MKHTMNEAINNAIEHAINNPCIPLTPQVSVKVGRSSVLIVDEDGDVVMIGKSDIPALAAWLTNQIDNDSTSDGE